jgi:c(7)-type cytochrome triheme protein
MKRILLMLPVILATIAVGFIVYRGESVAEDVSPEDGLSAEQTESAASSQYDVPDDILYTEPVESVVFSHDAHAADIGLTCNTCHEGIFEMDALSVQSEPDFNMKGLSEGKYCGTCHSSDSDMAFASDTQCARCHIGVTGLERVENGNSQES